MLLQVGRLISFLGSTAALGLMTVISVLIGYCFKSVPDALKSSVPIGQYLSVACMLYFGIRTITVRPPYYVWFPILLFLKPSHTRDDSLCVSWVRCRKQLKSLWRLKGSQERWSLLRKAWQRQRRAAA